MVRTGRYTPYLFVAPLIVLLVFVFGYPIVRIFEFSFKQVRGVDGPWIGLRNYEIILNQPLFWDSVKHNLQLMLAVPVMIVIALLISIVLYERVRGWRIYRTVLFVPFILSIPIVAVVLKKMFQFNGPINEVLRMVGLERMALDWIGSPDVALWTVMLVIIWRESALGIILFLSRLLSLDEAILEASQLDGANWWQRVRFVLLPQMAGVIEFYVVVSVITMLASVFSYIYMIGRGGPGTSTMVMELYIFNALTRNSLPGVASAVSVMLFIVSTILIFAMFYLRRHAREMEMG
jgi:ABC-type sugar transport system permease subunit